jgi:hypothetical protein
MAFGDDKFYGWQGKTLVLDPGTFAYDLPRRGADWQVQYFPMGSNGNGNGVVSELEQSGQHLVRAGEAAAQQVAPAMNPIEAWVRQNPLLALIVGAGAGVLLYRMLKQRSMRANPDIEEKFRYLIRGGAARDDDNFLNRVSDLMRKKYGYSQGQVEEMFAEEGAL